MSKFLNDKDFFMCTGGLMPAQMQTVQRVSSKKEGTRFLMRTDTACSSIIDFSCKKMMLLMAIIAVVVCALVIATGGMALIAAAAIGGAIGAVAGALICGQKAAVARTWLGFKSDTKILGIDTLTDKAHMTCALFGEEIRLAPHIKNWWQAAAVGLSNFAGEMFKCVMVGAAAAGGAVLLTEGVSAFAANAAANYLMTWTTGWGLGLRGMMGVMDGINQKYVNGTSTEDAVSSGLGNAAFGMERGTANSAYNVATGQGSFEDYTGLLGWGAPVARSSEGSKPGAETDPIGSNPWEGKPQSGKTGFKESPRMSRSEYQAYKKGMNEQGVEVVVDKKGVLPDRTRAAFDPETGTVYLRKGATNYEAFHEAQHAQQWKQLGKDAYLKQSRVQREQYVYDQIMKNKDQFSQAELDHARDYMNDVLHANGMEPMKMDHMGDGDLYEDSNQAQKNTPEKPTEEGKSTTPEKQKVLSKEGKTAKELAYEEMKKRMENVKNKVINPKTGQPYGRSHVPKSLEVAVNKKTGEVVIGENKTLNKGNPPPELHPKTKDMFKENNQEDWNEKNCSEADVADQIHKKGQNTEDYEYHAVEERGGNIQDKHTCKNCDVNMKDPIDRGDVTSNTTDSKTRRDDYKP